MPSSVTRSPPSKELSLSVLKASRVLRAVAEARSGATLTEIVAATALPTTVCHRLLATLEHERLVERQHPSGRYRLGLGLIGLASQALESRPASARTMEMIHELVSVTQEVALLMVEDRGEALCLARVEGDCPVNVAGSRVGSRLPLHCGGAPFAILAFSPDSFIEDYLSRPLAARTPRTSTDPAAIRARIREARSRGYAVGDEDLFEYVVAVGVPIFGPDRQLIGAVSLGGLRQRYSDQRLEEIGALLRDTAERYFARNEKTRG